MNKRSFRVSLAGKQKIQEARNKKGWKISQDDPRSLQAASLYLINEYARENQIEECDRLSWSRHLETIFKLKRKQEKQKIAQIKIELIKSSELCITIVERLIYEEEIYPAGISYGTWTRFCSQTRQEAIGENAFKAYCDVLGLNWQKIGEPVTKSDKIADNIECSPFQPIIYQNLVTPNCIEFIGREQQLQLLLQYIADERIYRISVEGMGGMGKTTLILEAAYLCLQKRRESDYLPSFKAIIFTSAQQQRLKVRQILPCLQQRRTLEDVFKAIAITLKKPQILQGNFDNQLKNAIATLRELTTLLIFDNLETFEDIENILAFIYELPPSVKVITTSRQNILLEDFQSIPLTPLVESEALKLIQHHLERKQLILESVEIKRLHQNTGGVPAAIVYAVGQLNAGYSLDSILPSMSLRNADFANFYFEKAIASLKDKPAYKLILTIAIFPQGATEEAIINVADVRETSIIESELANLQQLNLITQQQQQYQMLPLTREYTLTQLKTNSELEQALRYRWVNYYQNYLEEKIEVTENGWNDDRNLDREWKNIREVVDWCIGNNLYQQFLQLWQFMQKYTHVCGHWQERLTWMEWLETVARQNQDWENLIQALTDRGKTLILLDLSQHHQKAIALLESAWQLSHQYLQSIEYEIGINLAIIYLQTAQFELAHSWLDKIEKLLQAESLPVDKHNILTAKIFYYQAEIYSKQKKYSSAKQYYQQALKQAFSANWRSGVVYNQLSLAIIDIEQQQNLIHAQKILQKNMQIVESNQDRRCLAFCKRAYALLEKAKENQLKFIRWTTSAKEDFSYLGMSQQEREMQLWLENLDTNLQQTKLSQP